MAVLSTPLSLALGLLGVSGLVLVWIAADALETYEGRGARGSASFAALTGVGALGLAAVGATVGVPPSADTGSGGGPPPVWRLVLYGVFVLQTVPWLWFALWYTGQDERLGLGRREFLLGAVGPLVVLVVALWSPYVVGTDSPAVVSATVGAATSVLFLYWFVIHVGGVIAVLRTVYVNAHLETGGGVALAGAATSLIAVPSVAQQVWMAGLGGRATYVAWIAGGFLVTAAGLAVAVERYDALEVTPAPGNIGRAALISTETRFCQPFSSWMIRMIHEQEALARSHAHA